MFVWFCFMAEYWFSILIVNYRKYKLPMSRIIPFPKRNDASSVPDFPNGRQVLAVYPGTTALYKATVVNTQRKVTIPFNTNLFSSKFSGWYSIMDGLS